MGVFKGPVNQQTAALMHWSPGSSSLTRADTSHTFDVQRGAVRAAPSPLAAPAPKAAACSPLPPAQQ